MRRERHGFSSPRSSEAIAMTDVSKFRVRQDAAQFEQMYASSVSEAFEASKMLAAADPALAAALRSARQGFSFGFGRTTRPQSRRRGW